MLELIRDLIIFAYRHYIAKAEDLLPALPGDPLCLLVKR